MQQPVRCGSKMLCFARHGCERTIAGKERPEKFSERKGEGVMEERSHLFIRSLCRTN